MYERHLVGPLFRPWAEMIIEEIELSRGDRQGLNMMSALRRPTLDMKNLESMRTHSGDLI
ncbi:MAG: hypothetical protein M5U07_05915 [Xanthobacteraceae bacterium]|nr:hypothetical protein [Xanthobacteraceae bacterium]